MPGATAYGLHEGSRSEYLAQYAFASWGTAVAIPHQEDHGIDLSCTLMEREGQRYLARLPYTVQVKSNFDPLVFEGEQAVRWLIEHPLPFYLCVVDKAAARLSVYHTMPRFFAWSLGQWPDRLEMTPERPQPEVTSSAPQWRGDFRFTLGQPILDFTISDMLNDDLWARLRLVFECWLRLENDNITRVRTSLLAAWFPYKYRTNEDLDGSRVGASLHVASEEQYDRTVSRLQEPLEWVGEQLRRREDKRGEALAAMLFRHLFPNDRTGALAFVHGELNSCLEKTKYHYAGVDHLLEVLSAELERGSEERTT